MSAMARRMPRNVVTARRRHITSNCAVDESFLILFFSESLLPSGIILALRTWDPSSLVLTLYITWDGMTLAFVGTSASFNSSYACAQFDPCSLSNASRTIQSKMGQTQVGGD